MGLEQGLLGRRGQRRARLCAPLSYLLVMCATKIHCRAT